MFINHHYGQICDLFSRRLSAHEHKYANVKSKSITVELCVILKTNGFNKLQCHSGDSQNLSNWPERDTC